MKILEVEELCYILEGNGTIYKINSEPIDFKKGDIIKKVPEYKLFESLMKEIENI